MRSPSCTPALMAAPPVTQEAETGVSKQSLKLHSRWSQVLSARSVPFILPGQGHGGHQAPTGAHIPWAKAGDGALGALCSQVIQTSSSAPPAFPIQFRVEERAPTCHPTIQVGSNTSTCLDPKAGAGPGKSSSALPPLPLPFKKAPRLEYTKNPLFLQPKPRGKCFHEAQLQAKGLRHGSELWQQKVHWIVRMLPASTISLLANEASGESGDRTLACPAHRDMVPVPPASPGARG